MGGKLQVSVPTVYFDDVLTDSKQILLLETSASTSTLPDYLEVRSFLSSR